jgi:hypothetical protein
VAFLRFSRDKRGYEHFYLVQPPTRGKGRPRVLYWFRTPPNIRIGRAPFAPEIQRALESQNPDVAFDWTAIARTPIPAPAESEHWRERRRAERAMRAASEAELSDTSDGEAEAPVPADAPNERRETDVATLADPSVTGPQTDAALAASEGTAGSENASRGPDAPRRRRRRRRRKPQREQAVRDDPADQPAPHVLPPAEPEDGV